MARREKRKTRVSGEREGETECEDIKGKRERDDERDTQIDRMNKRNQEGRDAPAQLPCSP